MTRIALIATALAAASWPTLAHFTSDSVVGIKSAFRATTDGVGMVDITRDEHGLTDYYGRSTSLAPGIGMAVSTSNGHVNFHGLTDDADSVKPVPVRVFTSPDGKFSPSAICGNYLVVANSNLRVFVYSSGSWSPHTTVGTAGMFDMDRSARNIEWGCSGNNGASSYIAANTGGPKVSSRDANYRPKIHVFKQTGSSFTLHTSLNLDNWMLPLTDVNSAVSVTLWETAAPTLATASDAASPAAYLFATALERHSIHRSYVASVAAFYPEYGNEAQFPGKPMFLWDVDNANALVTTVDDRACASSTAFHTANMPLTVVDLSGLNQPAIFVGCPGTQLDDDFPPHVEMWIRVSTRGCSGPEDRLQRLSNLLPIAGSATFPGFSPVNTMTDMGRFDTVTSPNGDGPGYDLDNVAPGLALIVGSEGGTTANPEFYLLIGDPGYDSDTTDDLDTGRSFFARVTRPISATSTTANYGWSVTVEKTITPPGASNGEMFGANKIAASRESSADILAVGTPRLASPTLRIASSSRSVRQVSTGSASTQGLNAFSAGASLDATGRWMATTDLGRVVVFSDADSPHGFASTVVETAESKPALHSTVHTGQFPYATGSLPSGTDVSQFIGTPLVKFLPAYASFDGTPSLIVVGPTATQPAVATRPYSPRVWEAVMFKLRRAASAPTNLDLAAANATQLEWYRSASLALPEGYSACSHLFDRCADTPSGDNCASFMDKPCANRIEVLALPGNASAKLPDDALLARQLSTLAASSTPELLAPSRASSQPLGTSSGLPGCADGVTLALPDAGQVPSVVLLCVRNHLAPASAGAALALNNVPLPAARTDGRIRIGSSCATHGISGCLDSANRASATASATAYAATKITSGIMLGKLWIGAINDAQGLELFVFQERSAAFREFVSSADPKQYSDLNPIQCDYRQDVVIMSHLDTVITGNGGFDMNSVQLYHLHMDTVDHIPKVMTGHTIKRPTEVSQVDVCEYSVFGSAIIAEHSLLAEEGFVAIMSTGGSTALTSCTSTQNEFIADTPVLLSLYTVRADPLLTAALHDNGQDYAAAAASAALRHRSDETAESPPKAGADVSPSTGRLASVLARRTSLLTPAETSLHYVHTYTLSAADAHFPVAETSGGAVPSSIGGPRALGMRRHAYAVLRTAESVYPWALARQYATDTTLFADTRAIFGASSPSGSFQLDPVATLRAGAGLPRIFMQVASGVLQIDRRVVAVSHGALGGNAKSGSLLAPLASLEVAVQQACGEVAALCAPVVLIGEGPAASAPAAFLPAALSTTTPVAAYDATVSSASMTNTVTYNAPRLSGRWASFNVTIHGAGIDKTRIVFDLNNPLGNLSAFNNNPFRVGGLTVKDLTLDGGYRIHLSSAGGGQSANANGGVVSVGAAGTVRASLRMQRVRVAHGSTFGSGGLVAATNADVVIVDSVLGDGQADEAGGLVYADSATHLTLVRTSLSAGTTLGRDGGCVYATGSSVVGMDQVSLTGCASGSAGGAISASAAYLRMLRTELYQNRAQGSGGGIESSFGRVVAWQAVFSRNKAAGGDGGGARVTQSASTSSGAPKSSLFFDSAFLANSASGSGGSLSVGAQSEVVTQRCGFAYSEADQNGGALAMPGSAEYHDGGSLFHGCFATGQGGAVSLGSSAVAVMLGSVVQASGAESSGGGIACSAASLNSELTDAIARMGAAEYAETAADLLARGAQTLADVYGVDVASNKAPQGAGIAAVTCSGGLTKPRIRLNTIATPFSTLGAVNEYGTFVTDARTSPRGAGTIDHAVAAAYARFVGVSTGVRPAVGSASSSTPSAQFAVTASTTSAPFTASSVFSPAPRLAGIPFGTIDEVLPSVSAAVPSAQTGAQFEDSSVSSALAQGGGLYASSLSSSQSSLVLTDASFAGNSAKDGSGGCIYAAGDPADQECVGQAALCYNTVKATVSANYLLLRTRVTLASCEASAGPAVFWTQKPFQGVVTVATSVGQGLYVPENGDGPPAVGAAGGTLAVVVSGSKYFGVTSSSTPVPPVEATPSQLQILAATPLNATAEPGGAIAHNSFGGVVVQLVDPYGNLGSPSLFRSYTVAAAVTSNTGKLTELSGSTTQSYSAVRNGAFFNDLTVKGAQSDMLTVAFSLTSSTGINDVRPGIKMADKCSGRQQLGVTIPQACSDCPDLQRSDGLQCLPCTAGQVLDTAASSRGVCVNCAAGTFVLNNLCQPCPVGTASLSATLPSCTVCALGTFAPATGASVCTDCAAGFTSSGDRSTCNRCDDDQVATAGSTLGCQTCFPGHIPAANKSVCLPCAAGTVPLSGAGICTSCTASQFAPAGSAFCQTCPPGHIPAANKSVCLPCAAGTVPINGQCEACGDGTVAPAASSVCTPCGVGVEANARQSACVNCTAGTKSTGNGACTACNGGQFQADPGQSTCDVCAAGTFSLAGAEACTVCEGNTISAFAGASGCTACSTNEVAINGKTECGSCSPGTRPVTGTDGTLSCELCPAGQISPSGSECTGCELGTVPSADRTACLACPPAGVTCSGSAMTIDAGYWWSPGVLQIGSDVAGDPWAYLPEETIMHECPSVAACNVTLNDLLADARSAADRFAASLPKAQRRQATQAFIYRQLNASSSDTVACGTGHTGPRCARCEDGFSAGAGATTCSKCYDSGVNWLIVVTGIVIVVGAAAFLVNNSYRANLKNKAGSNVTPGLIRIVTNYLKIQATLGDFKAQAPAVIQSIRQGASTVSSGVPVDVGPVACAFSLNYERQLMGVVLMPIVIIVAVGIICLVLYCRAVFCPALLGCTSRRDSSAVQDSTGSAASHKLGSRSSGRASPPRETQASPRGGSEASKAGHVRDVSVPGADKSEAAQAEAIIEAAAAQGRAVPVKDRPVVRRKYLRFCQSAMTILLFLIYSMLVKQVFTSWSLYPYPIDGESYLLADFAVTTSSDAYGRITALAIIGVALWVVGIPALAIYLLYNNRDRLLDDDFASAFSFLYAGYNIGTARMVNAETIAQARAIVGHLESLTDSELAAIGVSKRRISGRIGSDEDDGDETEDGSNRDEAALSRPRTGASPSPGLAIEDVDEGAVEPGPGIATIDEGDAKEEEDDETATTLATKAADTEAPGTTHQRRNPFSGGRPRPPASGAAGGGKPMVPTASFVQRRKQRDSVQSRSANVAFLKTIVDDFETTAVKHDRVSWWFWEVVVLARLVLVTVVAVFVQDVFVQSYAALAIVIAALVAHLSAHPYSDSVLNFAETLGLLTVLVTQLGSLLWSLDSATTQIDDTAVTIVLIVINILVLVLFLIMLVLSILGARRIRSIPYCGPAFERAYYHERDLRQQYKAAKRRQDILEMAHSPDPKVRQIGQAASASTALHAAAVVGGVAAVGAGAAAGGFMANIAQ